MTFVVRVPHAAPILRYLPVITNNGTIAERHIGLRLRRNPLSQSIDRAIIKIHESWHEASLKQFTMSGN